MEPMAADTSSSSATGPPGSSPPACRLILLAISFATLLWELFKALIFGTLDQLQNLLGEELLQIIKDRIDGTVTNFLTNVMQLDPESMQQEKRAVEVGVI